MVVDSIRSLKSNSTPGPDFLPSLLFKQFPYHFAIPLKKIFHKSYITGVIPMQWKIAHVVPIFKNKGKRSDPANYRPISLTCTSCKLFERIMKNYMMKFALANNLISEHQHGFVSRKSTQTHLLESGNFWTYWLGEKEAVDVLYLDISKAFDTVSHDKLLYKLYKLGFRGCTHKWIESFLIERSQNVKINNTLSSSCKVKSGVPQGSVLGPLLFLLFINDIVSCVNECSIKIFADDCKLYLCVRKMENYHILLRSICSFFTWTDDNQLEIALQKCFILHLGSFNPNLPYVLKIPYAPIPETKQIKDLGVLVSDDLKFSDHCLSVSKKAFQRMLLIFRTCLSRDRSFLLATYKTYVRPLLEYNSPVWSPFLHKDIIMVEKVQKRFTKRIPGLTNLDYEERLRALNLHSLEQRRIVADLTQCYKIVHQ